MKTKYRIFYLFHIINPHTPVAQKIADEVVKYQFKAYIAYPNE